VVQEVRGEKKNKERRKRVDKTGRKNGRDENMERKGGEGNGVRTKEKWWANETVTRKGYRKNKQLMKVRRN
jgi:hypothetical protein